VKLTDRLLLRDYEPASTLDVAQTQIDRARFPAIDVHTHIGRREAISFSEPKRPWAVANVSAVIDTMDQVGLRSLVNLDGAWGQELEETLDRYDRAHPDRFFTFCRLDYGEFRERGFGGRLANLLTDSISRGARGLKIAKTLGLQVPGPDGKLIVPDDPELDEVWSRAGELDVPVLIHVADPVAFFSPPDERNEALGTLERRPEWQFHSNGSPSFERLIDALSAVLERHPGTDFIGAHVACYSENLAFVGQMCDRYANLYPEISARINQLGRQPNTARDFIVKYQDRVLYGTDGSPTAERHRLYFRILESRDDYISASSEWMDWRLYGLDLPSQVLEKVYLKNAEKVLRIVR
jgi:predicted TIM-barrel fold metal-dependent hydrolase